MKKPKTKIPENPINKAKAFVDEAREHFTAGDLAKSEALCRKAVETYPGSPEALFLLATLLSRLGHPGDATGYLEKAVTIRPAYAPLRLGLGSNYIAVKRLRDAIEAFEYALFLEPGKAKPYFSLGLLCLAGGQAGRGFKFIARGKLIAARAIIPGLFLKVSLLMAGSAAAAKGRVLLKKFRNRDAISLLKEEIVKERQDWPVYDCLAEAYFNEDLLSAARTALEDGLAVAPTQVNLLSSYSQVLCRFGRMAEAFSALDKVPSEDRHHPRYLEALGTALYKNNQAEEALSYLEEAAGKGGGANVHLLIGRCKAGLGDIEDAVPAFKMAIKKDPTLGVAYTALAKTRNISLKGPLFRALKRKLGSPFLPQPTRFLLHFAAASVYAQEGEHGLAFEHYKKGNALRDIPFCKETWSKQIDALTKVFSKSFMAEGKRLGNSSAKPIFIVGMPRSGTTLTEQILASHQDVAGAGERDIVNVLVQDFPKQFDPEPAWPEAAALLDQESVTSLAKQYLEDIEKIFPDAKRVTDKMPGNFLNLGLIGLLFPNAKIIHCRRNPVDTCLSNYMQPYVTFHPYAFDLANLGFYYREYERLMAHWHKVMPGRILDFVYEDVIDNPEREARKLLKFCNLKWDPACLEFHKAKTTVQTSSFAQVRQPIYKSSSEKWKKYERYLGPLLQALENS